MRTMRYLWLGLLLVLTTLPAYSAEHGSQGPPPVPGTRARPRLRSVPGVAGKLYTPDDAIVAADADMARLAQFVDADSLRYYRYLTLYNIPQEKRQDYFDVTSVVINSLAGLGLKSKARPTIVIPAWGGPDNILIRINLFDYHIDPAAWDRLGEKDPYFHQTIVKQVIETVPTVTTERRYYPGGVASDGQYYEAGYYDYPVRNPVVKESKPVKILAGAAWCNTEAQKRLGARLGTLFPVVRADWWIANVTLEPHYSDFLGIKSLDDFKQLTGFDKNADITEVKATIVVSGSDGYCPRVARNNRVLVRRKTFNGAWWETIDFKTSTGLQSVIDNFRNDKADAKEFIATMPNGLHAFLIVNEKNEPVAAGDINIVGDSTAHDLTVRNGRSCFVCHKRGINEFSSQFQKQVGARPDQADLAIYDKDPKKALEIRQEIEDVFGTANFDAVVKEDNSRYNAAILAATGGRHSAEEFSQMFASVWNGFAEDLIDPDKLCYEIGLQKPELEALLGLRYEGRSNGTLIQALHRPPIAIRRDQFEENFYQLGLLSTLRNRLPPVVPVAVPRK